MTSRERVRLALAHREPDRVPLDARLTIGVYRRVREQLGLPVPEHPSMGWTTEVQTLPPVAEALGLDCVDVRARASRRGEAAVFGALPQVRDEWGVVWRQVELPVGGFYYEMIGHPLANLGVADLARYAWPEAEDPGRTRGLEEEARHLHETTEFALIGQFGGGVFEQAWYMRGLESWMIDLMVNPEFADAVLDRICDIQTRIDVRCIEVAGRYIEAVAIGDDLGTQCGPMFSVATFERFVKPRLARRCQAIHAAFDSVGRDGKVLYHTCGDAYPFLAGLAEAGVDILDPVQTSAAEMAPRRLKGEFGDRLSFHGGIDTQRVLPFGSRDDVYREVEEKLQALAPGGGYIAAPVHNVQGDVPVGNLLALAGAMREFGSYPITVRGLRTERQVSRPR